MPPAPPTLSPLVQREEVQRQVAVTSAKAAAVVDEALQLSNVEVIAAYLFGKPDAAKPMPVAQRLDAELAGGGWGEGGRGWRVGLMGRAIWVDGGSY